MTDGVYALIGVFVGTVATAGPQFWDRLRNTKRADDLATATALAVLLDALWGRMVLNIAEAEATAEQRMKSHTDWVHARNGFGATSVASRFSIVTWLDLELTDVDHRKDTTWHNANIRHGHLTQYTVGWVSGNAAMSVALKKRMEELKAKYWKHTHVPDGAITPVGMPADS